MNGLKIAVVYDMNLLIAAIQDIPSVMQLIDNCITDMQSKGLDQWGDFYPTEEIINKREYPENN